MAELKEELKRVVKNFLMFFCWHWVALFYLVAGFGGLVLLLGLVVALVSVWRWWVCLVGSFGGLVVVFIGFVYGSVCLFGLWFGGYWFGLWLFGGVFRFSPLIQHIGHRN